MEESFIKKELLSTEHLRALVQPNDSASYRRILSQCALLGISFGIVLYAPAGPWQWAALVLHAASHFAFFGLLHESCHRTAFTSRTMNTVAGWIAAISQPMSPTMMRAFHFQHHRHTHELEQDPELARMAMMLAWPRHIMWLATLTGLHLVAARAGWAIFAALVPRCRLWDMVLPFVDEKTHSAVAWEARLLVLVHAGLLTLAFIEVPAILWFYAGLLVSHAFLGAYTVCEHRGLPSQGGVEDRTRSINTNGFIRWLMWNMPYHAEHHAWPAVPWHALPALHKEVREHFPHKEHGILALHWRHGRD